MLRNIYVVEIDAVYYSKSGYRFKVVSFAKHAQACCVRMVIYVSLDKTEDSEIGTQWAIEEPLFLQLFREEYNVKAEK